jgi:hypothetical protein
MDQLVRLLGGLTRGLARLLGEQRRDWVSALLAETDDAPAPAARLAWLGGGLSLVLREVLVKRIVPALAFAAGAAALVWIGWPGAPANSAVPVNRMYVAGTLALLAGLPPLVRRYAGPVRAGWAPRAARAGGYAVALALVAATAAQQRAGSQLGRYLPVIAPVWAMDAGFLLILGGYVTGLLVLTGRRLQFTRWVLPAAVGIGALTATALYPLAPFGLGDMAESAAHSLHGGPVVAGGYLVLACYALAALAVPVAVHAAATRLADRDTRAGVLTPAWQAAAATAAAMATAAILVALGTTATIALLPGQVPGPLPSASDGSCPACGDPWGIGVPVSLRREYAHEENVSGAGDGAGALIIVPLIGTAVGALRGHLRYPTAAARPARLPGGA